MSVVCCQVEIYATDRVLQSVVCLIVIEERQIGGLGPLGLSSYEKKRLNEVLGFPVYIIKVGRPCKEVALL